MTDLQVDLVSWNRFITRNFAVVPELLGQASEFQFEKGQITIELPTADKLTDSKTDDSPLRIVSYKEEDGCKIPLKIAVNNVDVLVRLKRRVNIPEEVLTRHPNPIDLLSNGQQKQLDKLAKAHGDVANRAFDLWIRTLRWKSGNGAIGRPDIHGAKSGWGTYLLNNETMHRFWVSHEPITLYMYECITLAEWYEVEETLKRGQESPVYIDLMFDGIEQFNLGYLQRSVVDLAAACEAFMRARVTQNLPKGLNDAVLAYIGEANIRRVQEHLFKETLSEEQMKLLKNINSHLNQLFDARNTILHSGHKEDLTLADCKKYIEATKKLIAIG